MLPTFAELAGGDVPAGLDGISILPTLLGNTQKEHDYLYWTWDGTEAALMLTQEDADGVFRLSHTWPGVGAHLSVPSRGVALCFLGIYSDVCYSRLLITKALAPSTSRQSRKSSILLGV